MLTKLKCCKCEKLGSGLDFFKPPPTCQHILCGSCLNEKYFDKAAEGKKKCDRCPAYYYREDYTEGDTFEVDQELGKRKMVLDVFNKRRTDRDFPPGPEGDELYDQYLEKIEDMISVLTSPEATKEEKEKVRREIKAEKNHAQNG